MKNTSERPILVTGSHRSGTTFVGKILALSSSVGYVHEPFNGNEGIEGIDHSFVYVKENSPIEDTYFKLVSDVLEGKAKFKRTIKPGDSLVKKAAKYFFRSRKQLDYILAHLDPRVKRLLIKDPIACMSAEWLHREFNMEVIVLIRHPAAFAASVKRLGWKFEFREFTRQEELMNDYLNSFLNEIDQYSSSDVGEAAVLWKCIYSVLFSYLDRNPDMIAVRHEDVSCKPEVQFKYLYDKLDLGYSPAIENKIKEYTNERNPTNPVENKTHVLKRDSRSNVKRWKKVLTEEEIDLVRSITRDIANEYYGPEDW